ncbi:LysR family transcriptional regulator [uncultured Tateyamaria sp.]|uniref:LysR family transcriptional regulator n=1 Tax=uncultured Tateyamaria sp. TaxID=455651 RepID=UPI002631E871|nr:LysR family transcriptional regulator [uncultured Tateyamaria sp.]
MQTRWDDLRLFLAVARAETLSGASKAVRLDAATLGRRVARLERDLNTVLFVKSPQGYALTDMGERLMIRAQAAEVAVRAATDDVAGHDGAAGNARSAALSGQIRIGAPDGCANFLLPQVCADLSARHPDLDIQIVALPRVFNLSRREADLAIAVSAPTAGRLTVQRITDYKLHFAAGAQYLDSAPPIRTLRDLQDHRIIGYIPDMIFDRELDYLADAGLPRVALTSNSVSVQLNLLRQGGGVGVVHDFALDAAPDVRRILLDAFSITRSFFLIRHAADQGQGRLSRFATLLTHGLRTEVARLEKAAIERV